MGVAQARRSSKPSPAAVGHITALTPVIARLQQLSRTDNWRNLFYLGQDWLVIVISVLVTELTAGHAFSWLVYGAALILIGSRMRALMNLTHQASHWQLFKDRAMNTWIGRLLVAWP